MRASSQYIRALVRGIAWDAEDAGTPFADALKSLARAKIATIDKGKVLVSGGSGGTSAQYALPAVGTMTADDILDAVSRVLDRVDVLFAAAPTLTDSQLLTALLTTTWGVKSVGSSFATLSH